MYLFFDTETTGIPRDANAPASNLTNWPRLVQIAWLRLDARGNHISSNELIIRPEGFVIPRDATRIHGITTEKAVAEGVSLKSALTYFSNALSPAKVIVAHNLSFDEKIVGAEFFRMQMANPLESKSRLCTMKASTDYCRLPGPYGHKWPRLSELFRVLFNKELKEGHTASTDVRACAKCFFELVRLGIITVDDPSSSRAGLEVVRTAKKRSTVSVPWQPSAEVTTNKNLGQRAQIHPPNENSLVSPDDVSTVAKLRRLYEEASMIDHEDPWPHDQTVVPIRYVGQPCWAHPLEGGRFICLTLPAGTEKWFKSDRLVQLEHVNRISYKYSLVRQCINSAGSMLCSYVIPVLRGITKAAIVEATREFIVQLNAALQDYGDYDK